MFRFLHQTEDIMDTELTPTQMVPSNSYAATLPS